MDDWRLWLTREEHEHASIEQLKKSLAASRALVERKDEALQIAREHCNELREAWERGILEEQIEQGGTRSKRNTETIVVLRDALALTEEKP